MQALTQSGMAAEIKNGLLSDFFQKKSSAVPPISRKRDGWRTKKKTLTEDGGVRVRIARCSENVNAITSIYGNNGGVERLLRKK